MRRTRVLAAAVALVVTAGLVQAVPTVAKGAKPVDVVTAAERLGLTCAHTPSGLAEEREAGVAYMACSGEIASFDGITLDTTVSLPVDPGHRPLPTVMWLSGWAGAKASAQAAWQPDAWPAGSYWNQVWWAHFRGYATISFTPRGFHASCGIADADPACARGETHIADAHFEVRDAKHLLGVLVDAGIADPARLAATGESYGGAMALMMATSKSWLSPVKLERLRLAAAITQTTWSDLEGALVPNGRPAGEGPVGVVKQDLLSGFYALGRANGQGRYGTNPHDYGSWFDGAHAVWSAGEPYGTEADKVAAAWSRKSSMFNDGFFAALARGEVEPVPILAVQGWGDTVFPAGEMVQLYDKLRAIDHDYPISLAFADVGHNGPASPRAHWEKINELQNAFLDAHLKGRRLDLGVRSLPSSCGEPVSSWTTADDFERLATHALTLVAEGTTQLVWQPTSSSSLTTDPVLTRNPARDIARAFTNVDPFPCPVAPADPTATTWTFDVEPTTLIGLPRVHATYALSGSEAMLVGKLWDIAPTGARTLVTRGVYRLSTSWGDPQAGTIEFDLFGNHWLLEPGHQVQLELAASDSPYLRSSNLPFTLEVTDIKVTLPVLHG